jgi:Fic family protein
VTSQHCVTSESHRCNHNPNARRHRFSERHHKQRRNLTSRFQPKHCYGWNVEVERLRNATVGRLVPISGTDPRFGEPFEHWAYVPGPLPDTVELGGRTWTAVAAAAGCLGRLDQAGQQLPDPSMLRRPTLRREAQSTSALEGTFAPLVEVLEVEPGEADRRSPELREVLNYVRAADYAYDYVLDRPFTLQFLCELHALLMDGTPSDGPERGKVRTTQVVIGAATGRVRDARFVPPPPGDELTAGLRAWVEWANASHDSLPPIVEAALAHYQFETLHPFNDGNGRIGRLVIVLQLMRSGVVREPLLAVSPWFEARRREYQDELLRVSESGDWDRWVSFFAEAIRAQAEDTSRKVDELLAFQRDAKDRCQRAGVRGLARDLAEGLIGRPVLTIAAVQRRHDVSSTAAAKAVQRLVELGLVREVTGGNYARVYVAAGVVDVVSR